MLTRILVAFAVLLAAPAWGKDAPFVHKADPFDKCETVSNARPGIFVIDRGFTVLKCGGVTDPRAALWSLFFELGSWSGAYDTFTLRGGVELETVGRPHLGVSDCRGPSCSYYSSALIFLPFDVLFSPEVMRDGLEVKAAGGPKPVMLYIAPDRIAALRQALIEANFIQAEAQ